MKKTSSLILVFASLLISGLVYSADFTDSKIKQRESAGNKIFEFYSQEIASNNYVEKIFDDALRYRYIDYYLTASTGTVTCLASFRNASGVIATQNVVSGVGITTFYSDLLTLRFMMDGATGNVTGNIRFYNSLPADLLAVTVNVTDLISTNPTIYNLELTTENVEYSQVLPNNTKKLSVSIVDGTDANNYRIAFETGHVASSASPYLKYTQNVEFSESDLNLISKTLYIGSSVPSKVAQIIVWE